MSKTDNIIRLDEAQLHDHLDRKITESVEETLNGLLDAEADRLCGAGRPLVINSSGHPCRAL